MKISIYFFTAILSLVIISCVPDKKSEERLKEDCFNLGGVVVLVTEDKDYDVGNRLNKGLGSSQARMVGVAYKY